MKNEDLLKKIEEMILPIREDISELKTDVAGLKKDNLTLDMKIDAIHDYQKQAQREIIDIFFESNEAVGKETKILTKRVDRIEKHLNLPPFDH